MLSLCIRKDDLLHQELYQRLQKRRRNAKKIFAEYEKSVRSVLECSKMTLNGPKGTVSVVTVRSVDTLY